MTTDATRYIVEIIDRMDDSKEYTISNPDISSMQSVFGGLVILRIQDIVTGITAFYFLEPGMKIHVVPIKVN